MCRVRVTVPRHARTQEQRDLLATVAELAVSRVPSVDTPWFRHYYILNEEDIAFIKLKHPSAAATLEVCGA